MQMCLNGLIVSWRKAKFGEEGWWVMGVKHAGRISLIEPVRKIHMYLKRVMKPKD